MKSGQPKGQKQILVIVAGVLAAILIILIPNTSEAQLRVSTSSTKKEVNGRKTTINYKDWQKEYKIQFEGEFELSDNDEDIIKVSRGGYFEISRSAFGTRRKVIIESDNGNELVKEYFVGRSRVPFEPEGREWLAGVLPDIVRSTTIGAESRVDRFYRKGGVDGVLDEVNELEGDYLKHHYLNIMLDKQELSDEDLAKVIIEGSDEIGSDYYISELLKNNERQLLNNETTLKAYIEASEEIDSDHYRAEVLKKALRNDDLSDDLLEAVLESARDVDSDHYLTEILRETLDERELNDDLISIVIKAARSIGSDHYQSQLFRDALRHDNISSNSYWEIVDAAGEIGSDHYKTELLRNTGRRHGRGRPGENVDKHR